MSNSFLFVNFTVDSTIEDLKWIFITELLKVETKYKHCQVIQYVDDYSYAIGEAVSL